MALLNIRRADGSTESRELSKTLPLTIGRQPFNDICIPEDNVAPMQCRISWNKTGFEATSATPEGIEINDATVAHVTLKSGDIIRIGSVDFIFDDASSSVAKSGSDSDRTGSRKSKSRKEPADKPVDDMSLFEGEVQTESQAILSAMSGEEDRIDSNFGDLKESPQIAKPAPRGNRIPTGAARPGEQEILRSPLVLGLAGGGLALALITGIFWFLIGREQSNRHYDRAVQELNDGQYSQSISTFERFIAQYPGHGLRRQADRGLAKAQIQKEISGAAPSWKRGLERLTELIKMHRNESDFGDLHSTLYQYAEQISIGAAKSAETIRDGDLLTVSQDAQNLLERYSDPSAPPTSTVGRIKEQRAKADRAIAKQSKFDLAMKLVDAAIVDRKPMLALSERERLVRGFPEFISSKRVKEALQRSLDLERSVVATDETERPADTKDDKPPQLEQVLGVLHARSRTEDNSQGAIVFVTAKDSCYAIDPATGELVWRRVTGVRPPFFPIPVTGAQSSVLLFDTRKQELLACQAATGQLIWRQRLDGRAISKPLVHEGQIYLPVDGNMLVRIDVDTGRISATVRFSQNLAGTPVLSRDGNFVLVPGEMAMIYALTLRTTSTNPALSAVATTFTDHAAGSISAPPLSMGRLLLLCENNLADSARLRLWDASRPENALIELESVPVAGQCRDAPVLRGNQLVVPSSGEQFAAFAVSDEPGRTRIAPIGQYRADQNPDRQQIAASLFVTLGSDGQFWSAGSAFRRFEIASNAIRMDSNSTAAGIASQPLQAIGEQFFVGRKSRHSDAVTFSAVDRDKLFSPWRIIVGDAPLEMISTRDGGLAWVGESGTLYSVGKNRLAQGGVDLKAGADMELPVDISKPVRASVLHDQRMIVFAQGETIRMFVINSQGQVVSNEKQPEFPDTDPILLDEGLVLPLPARLKLHSLSGSKKPAQDWIAPIGDKLEHKWSHLVRIDGREFVSCDNSGRLTRVQYRSGDVPHLASVAELQLEHPVELRPFIRGEFLYVADATGLVRQLNVRSFDTDGQASLTGPIKSLWDTGTNILVVAGDRKLHCLSDGKTMSELWSFDLAKLEPTGSTVVRNDAVWIACRNGTVLVLNAATGTEIRRIELPQMLSIGLRQIQESIVAVASDGTLYRLE